MSCRHERQERQRLQSPIQSLVFETDRCLATFHHHYETRENHLRDFDRLLLRHLAVQYNPMRGLPNFRREQLLQEDKNIRPYGSLDLWWNQLH